MEGKFNKKTDIWALGCVFYEVCVSKKAFTSEWATIEYARKAFQPSLIPFATQAHTMAKDINALVSNMLQVKTNLRWNVDTACRQIVSMIGGKKPVPTEKYYWTKEQLIGTESPIWTSISPRIDQIFPASVPYEYLNALIERRKQLTAARLSYLTPSNPATIWSHLFLAYTYYHHPSQTQSSWALGSLGAPLLAVSAVPDKILRDRIHASLMSAFAWFNTQQSNLLV